MSHRESGTFWPLFCHPNLPPNNLCLLIFLPLPRAKGFQHQRMTNGAMNVEIGNPTYKMYEGGEPDDVGGLLDADFALDPDKVGWKAGRVEGQEAVGGLTKGVGLGEGQRWGWGGLGHRHSP